MMKHKLFTLFVALIATTALWASNVITYTASSKLNGYNSSLSVGKTTFGPVIISHEFANGTGIITCDGEITMIGRVAFRDCKNLISITIPHSVTTIGGGAFEYCSGLTSVTIPNSVTTIGDLAFYFCSGLTSVTIPNSVTTIGESAFRECIKLTSITIPNSVTRIESSAFSGCSGLTSVTIGNSVTTIGSSAFYGCSSLTSVTIPNSVTTIGDWAFYGCSDLTKTNYTGTIADWCKIKFDNGYSNPMNHSHNFYINDVEVKDLVIPEGVEAVGNYAFENCTGLTSVIIPNSVTTIGDYAFRDCSGLTLLTIGNSVTTIGDSAFEDCRGLTSVTIPNSVTTIGKFAFYGCKGLTSITCEAVTPPSCAEGCFEYVIVIGIPLYVPAESIEDYKKAEQWNGFVDIRPITAQEVEVTEIEAEPTESTVEIVWPIVVDAETYTIEIRLGDKLICSIIFNAQGQLLSINFNPAPSRGHMYATTAEGTATGWAYTIAGLNPGTNYTYSVVAKNASDQVIDTKNGSFTTTAPTGLLDVNDNSKFLIQNSKLIKDGHLYILRDGNLYTATGARVK